MAVINPISSPVGIDIPIKKLQTYFSNKLFTGKSYNSYNRVYRNDRDGKLIPEAYTSSKEYTKDLFTNDKVDALSFFYVVDSTSLDESRHEATIDIIFSCNLEKIYAQTHRADETPLNEVLEILKKEPYMFKPQEVYRDFDNVYSDFTITKKQAKSLEPYCHFKIRCELIYNQKSISC